MIVFFAALLAIPIVQVALGPHFARAGAPIVIDRSQQIIIALSKHLQGGEIGFHSAPRLERRPKAG
jgi:hypothetical protein